MLLIIDNIIITLYATFIDLFNTVKHPPEIDTELRHCLIALFVLVPFSLILACFYYI